MKIGILQCDDVNPALQPDHGNYPAMFEALLREQAPDATFAVYRCLEGELPASVGECDAYITTGSKSCVNDDNQWIRQLEDFVRALYEANKKLVGICFGHQLIARALGGEVLNSEKGWGVGMSFNAVSSPKPWMQPQQDKLDLIVSHQDQVVTLPPEAQVLASSRFCPFYMLAYGECFMSVQGHPEFSKTYSRDLMNLRRGVIPDERIREGQVSLNAEVDDRVMMSWIMHFFKA
ncbi:glutamine amidotransferase-related protein [Pokkaliibacter sp. CJK22405]|uniref:glutamine amidotransferase-related protein n=1 Tax=Pokkaliibacter sp. CJK22405 TaxID=3384615 RepID=UPI0039851CE7